MINKKSLSQLYYLKKDIKRIKEKIQELENMATNITSKTDGMPISGNVDGKVNLIDKIIDLKAELQAKENDRIKTHAELLCFIENESDALMRLILTYRFVDCYSWRKVARLVGGGNTEDSVRKQVVRYIRKSPQKKEKK